MALSTDAAGVRSPLVEQALSGRNRTLQRLAAEGMVPLPLEELVPLQVALARVDDDEIAQLARTSLGEIELSQLIASQKEMGKEERDGEEKEWPEVDRNDREPPPLAPGAKGRGAMRDRPQSNAPKEEASRRELVELVEEIDLDQVVEVRLSLSVLVGEKLGRLIAEDPLAPTDLLHRHHESETGEEKEPGGSQMLMSP